MFDEAHIHDARDGRSLAGDSVGVQRRACRNLRVVAATLPCEGHSWHYIIEL